MTYSISAWSYSRLKDYETCPYYAALAHAPQSEHRALRSFGPQAERGVRVHEVGEKYLLRKRNRLPAAYRYLADEMYEIRELGAEPEYSVALTDKWEQTGWMDTNTWLRLKIDAMYRVESGVRKAIDFKTGKIYDDHPQQLELYGLVLLKIDPTIEKVELENWYLDLAEIVDVKPITRDEESKLTKKWTTRANKMLKATEFPAKPGWKCRYCDFAASKGGPCQDEKK